MDDTPLHDAKLRKLLQSTSGASNVAVLPSSGKYLESHVLSDKDNIHAYEKNRESLHSYAQRAAEIAVVETGLATGIRATVIMPPTIYGIGSGFFNRLSVQIPNVIQTSLNRGRAIRVGDHNATYNHVHVDDLVAFYEMVLARIVEGKEVPHGEKGILFTDGGEFTWTEFVRTRGDIGREWGWEPRKTHSDFLNTFEIEVDAVLEAGKILNYTSHLKGH
ncbi:hypothetical protein DL770_010453 [Monosporascus sp. CRB-9-2]|nr:hypothetical protein DL770_010453 [Monosporascus sp. CRB-9-2]